MPPRPRSRTTRAFPKTLTGIFASVALAVLAALGIKTDRFGKPATPPSEHPSATRAAPPPGNLPYTPGSFETAKRMLYELVYSGWRRRTLRQTLQPLSHEDRTNGLVLSNCRRTV